jgi:hypothetical protein
MKVTNRETEKHRQNQEDEKTQRNGQITKEAVKGKN